MAASVRTVARPIAAYLTMTDVSARPAVPPPSAPAWARVADGLVLALLVAAGAIWAFGGGHVHLAGFRISLSSPWRPAFAAVALLAIRHLFDRREPLPWRLLRPAATISAKALPVVLPLAAVCLLLASVAGFYEPGTGFTRLIAFGEYFDARALPAVRSAPHFIHKESWGYDGQFYAQMAVDPLLRDPATGRALDTPLYRGRRILFAWTAYLLGLGRPAWILQAYALQNVIAWLVLAVLLTRWFPRTTFRRFLPWFGCLFGSGMLGSVRLALLEGPSMLVITLAVMAMESGRDGVATALSALGGLGRDTNLFGMGLLVSRLPHGRRDTVAVARRVGLAVAPLLAWTAYLAFLYSGWTNTGPGNFAPPLAGYLAKWADTLDRLRQAAAAGGIGGVLASPARFSALVLVGVTAQAAFLICRREWTNAWWRVGAGYVVLMAFLGPAVWGGDPGAAIRVVLPMTVAFNVLVARSRWFWPLVLLGNAPVVHGLWLLAN